MSDDLTPFQEYCENLPSGVIVRMPEPPCTGCGNSAIGQLRLMDHPEVWCVDCVRAALLRLSQEAAR